MLSCLLWGLAVSAIARAQEGSPTPPADLDEISRALASDAAAQSSALPPPAAPAASSSHNPDLAFITDVAAAWFSAEDPYQTGGHDPTRRGFNLQQVEMSVQGAVDPFFQYKANIVFAQAGVEVEEAYGTSTALPGRLQLKVGQFLHRAGRLNETHPHAWAFVDQPIAVGRNLGAEGGRGLGLELSWLSPLPWFVELSGAASQIDGEATARSWQGAAQYPLSSPADLLALASVDQFFELSPDTSLMWGLSALTGPNGTGRGNRSDLYVTDLYLKWRPIRSGGESQISWQSELFCRRRQVPELLLTDLSAYSQVEGVWRRRWGLALRGEWGSPAADQEGGVGADPLDPDWIGPRWRESLALTFWPTEFSRLRLQGAGTQRGPDAPGTETSVFLSL